MGSQFYDLTSLMEGLGSMLSEGEDNSDVEDWQGQGEEQEEGEEEEQEDSSPPGPLDPRMPRYHKQRMIMAFYIYLDNVLCYLRRNALVVANGKEEISPVALFRFWVALEHFCHHLGLCNDVTFGVIYFLSQIDPKYLSKKEHRQKVTDLLVTKFGIKDQREAEAMMISRYLRLPYIISVPMLYLVATLLKNHVSTKVIAEAIADKYRYVAPEKRVSSVPYLSMDKFIYMVNHVLSDEVKMILGQAWISAGSPTCRNSMDGTINLSKPFLPWIHSSRSSVGHPYG